MDATKNLEAYLFREGTNYKAYEYFGVHGTSDGFVFRVWAPHAHKIELIGDFNGWQGERHELRRVDDVGVWEIHLSNQAASWGDRYKYRITGEKGTHDKADPYAFATERPPATASVMADISGYAWRDNGWMAYRRSRNKAYYSEPMNVYEIHLGSWKLHEDGSCYTYSELATELAPYVKQMGYTHIALLPVTEYPASDAWGYQACSYFAPTARYGSPLDFMAFVDSMHEAGIGVLLDWFPAHFSKDEHGLLEFDGSSLYECREETEDPSAESRMERFDVGKTEVENFLISSAAFWLRSYHVDGLRVGSISSMVCLDHGRSPGEWTPNVYGDNRRLEAIAFFRKMNSYIKSKFPDVLMIAEESTARSNVTTLGQGGLGFDMKWNLGWMNDTLAYTELDPLWRKYHHEKMTFSLVYAFGEKYILPLPHDAVVHGKKSVLDKQSGDYWQKFAGNRALFGYMMTHPGKKLLFMGAEIGQFREWDFKGEIEWFLLDYESHAKLQRYVSDLNHFYLQQPALWQVDDSWDGFRWIDADNRNQSILSYRRVAKDGKELIVLINFTPVVYEDYRLGVPLGGTYQEIFNSDRSEYGGSGVVNDGLIKSENVAWNYLPQSVRLRVPPLGMTVLRCEKEQRKNSAKRKI